MTATANHALQRTAPRVTLAASGLRLSPTMQPARRAPQSLSLGSFGVATRLVKPALLLFCFCTFILRADADDSTNAALSLSYQQFDQTPHSGWRVLAEDGKHLREAATLIEAYLASHTELDRFQRSNLHWHAAQALALAGDSAAALKHIPAARLDPEPPTSPVCWNDYVAATEAFLQHDRAKLLAARERIAKSKPDDPNLPIVDSLITHFDEPYSKAYKTQ